MRSLLACLAAALLVGPAARAGAQTPPETYARTDRGLSFGAEFTGTFAPKDPGAFFDYSDYERDDLRLARVRLLAEWHLHARASLVAEIRSENGNGIDPAAWYLRWRPLESQNLDLQIGRIPPVIGAYARRAYGRDNLVIGTPLAYSYLTSLRPDALPATVDDLLRMRGRGWEPSFPVGSQATASGIPLISSSRWDEGIQARWRVRRFDLAGALTANAPATPRLTGAAHPPAISARVSTEPIPGWTLGLSAARGQWLQPDLLDLFTPHPRGHRQTVVGVDTEFSRYRWIVRAEAIRSAFDLPIALAQPLDNRVDAWSGFVEGRVRLSPRWQIAARGDHLAFGAAPSSSNLPWDARVTRGEITIGFRALRTLDLRAGWQQNWRDGGRIRTRGVPMMQILYWL
jgi:hypothetical protein